MNVKLGAFLIAICAVLGILATLRLFKRDRLSTRLFLMWILIWFSIGFFALFPFLVDRAMKFANVGSRPFFITLGAILILYVILFYATAGIARLDRKINKLTRDLALLDFKQKNVNSRKGKELESGKDS